MWCHNNEAFLGTSYVYHSRLGSVSPEYQHRAEYLGNKLNNCTLKIKDLRAADSGTYKFRFETDYHGGKWTGHFGVTLSVSGEDMSPSGVTGAVREGDSVTLTCYTRRCSPTQTKRIWFKNGQPFSLTHTTANTLRFNPVSYGDSGDYACAVKEYRESRSQGFTLVVIYAPKDTSVSVSPSGEIVEGSSVILTCSSNANPPVQNYTWFKTNGAAVWEKGSGQSFLIALIHPPQYAPKDTSVSVSPSGEIVEGSSVILTCSSNANPPVERYAWFKTNGAAVWEKGSGQSFTIAEISSGDSGQYYCEAQNKHAAHNSTTRTLTITGTVRIIQSDMRMDFSRNFVNYLSG
ncbi:SN protein, partial [Amia calva]|nr:SN protein [Amia calva]